MTVRTCDRSALVDLFYTPDWGTDPTQSHLFGDPTMTTADRRRHLNMSAYHDAWDLLPTIQCPTLVLHGKEDRITPCVNAEVIADAIPEAQLHIQVTAVCSARNAEQARALGAHRVIDYAKEDFTALGTTYDLVIDLVGNRSLADLRRAVEP